MDKVKVGVIVNTHALKGEVKVKSFSDFSDVRFAKGSKLMIAYRNEYINVRVKSCRESKCLLLVLFDGYEDINLIEKYKGCEIFVSKQFLHDLEEDEVYFHDLMECDVYDEDDNFIGKVEEVLETGANAVLRVNKKILIPFVKAFIKESDIENKKIVIHKVEGLLWK